MAARMEMIDTTIISSTKVNPPWWKGRRFADFIDILATMLILSRSCITPKHPALLRHLICRHDSRPVLDAPRFTPMVTISPSDFDIYSSHSDPLHAVAGLGGGGPGGAPRAAAGGPGPPGGAV